MNIFGHVHASLRGANVGCVGATLLVLFCVAAIFGLVLLAWWPVLGGE